MAGGVNVGVFGGSGFYSFLDDVRQAEIDTPYGAPSAPVSIGRIGEHEVAFLPRHGVKHHLPPHKINYRANLWALKELGVSRIIGPCAAGSLKKDVEPGQFVVSDQLIDNTSGRIDTFYDGPQTTHVSFADPYCPELRELTVSAARNEDITVHETGTMIVVQGPRFSTRAESRRYQDMGGEVINMTQYPEAYLARELEICYVNVALITDYDVGVKGEIDAVTHEAVIEVFNANNERLRKVLFSLIPQIPRERSCICSRALEGARMET